MHGRNSRGKGTIRHLYLRYHAFLEANDDSDSDDYEEALATANDTEFGLSAGIVTTSLKYATHFKRNAEAGMVMVNVPTAGVDFHVPFGGRKGSSYGSREQGKYAAEFFTVVKTAYTAAG